MTLYASTTRVKDALRITDTVDDSLILLALEAACESIDDYCGRSFGTVTTTRYYEVEDSCELEVDDLASATFTLATKSTYNGGYDITWTAADYFLSPLNGRRGGVVWPYTEIHAIAPRYFLEADDIPTVSLTATFGWPSVPARITQAAVLQAQRFYKRMDSPLGVAGVSDMGIMRVSRGLDSDVQLMIERFRRGTDAIGGIA